MKKNTSFSLDEEVNEQIDKYRGGLKRSVWLNETLKWLFCEMEMEDNEKEL